MVVGNRRDLPNIPTGLEDTRDEDYCWRIVDTDGETVTYLTMDWSAKMYEDGMSEENNVRIVSWEGEY